MISKKDVNRGKDYILNIIHNCSNYTNYTTKYSNYDWYYPLPIWIIISFFCWSILKKNSKALIEIDGGVSLQNAKKLLDNGADVLVAGNTVFNSANPIETIQQLKNSLN